MNNSSTTSDTTFPHTRASSSALYQGGTITTTSIPSQGAQPAYHAIADDSDVEPQLPKTIRKSSNIASIIPPPLEQRSFSSGDSNSRNAGRSDAERAPFGENKEDSLGPRFPKDVRKFTNRVGREGHGENGGSKVHLMREEDASLIISDTGSLLSGQYAPDINVFQIQGQNHEGALPTLVNPCLPQSHLPEDRSSQSIRQLSLPGLVRLQQERNDHASSQQMHGSIGSFPLPVAGSPQTSTPSSSHSSLGNRISTFFGGHRPSGHASNKRPSTSQGLMSSSSISRLKPNKAEKRSLLGRSSNDRPQFLEPFSVLSATDEFLGGQDTGIQSRVGYHAQTGTNTSNSRQKLDILRPSTNASDFHEDQAVNGIGNNFRSTTAVREMGSDVYISHLTGDGQINFYHQLYAETPVQSVHSDLRKDYIENPSHQGTCPDLEQSFPTLPLAHPSAARPPEHSNPEMPSSVDSEGAITTLVDEGNSWDSPSKQTLGTYPHLKEHRQKQFSWEVNPSLPDGREMMGFGGDLGKKRLLATEAVGPSMSSLSPYLGSGKGLDENVPLPYILGYERHVLAFEPLIQDAFYCVAGNKHTFYPEDLPPPKRVLDIGTGTGAWPIAMAQKWRDTTFVGLDIAPVQTDLSALSAAEQMFSHEFPEPTESTSKISWQDIAGRVTWEIGDFLQDLPFDTGSFDMVHIRFVGLGVPETSWSSVFSEAARVLKPVTGVLEIVEMSKILPSATPHSLKASFASLMLSSFINQHPFIPIRPALAMSALTVNEIFNVAIRRSEIGHDDPPNVLLQTMGVWVDSALGKGKHGRGKGMSGNAYGNFSKAPMGATKTPKWGEGIIGEQALSQLRLHVEDGHQSTLGECDFIGLAGDKQVGQVLSRHDSRSTSQSSQLPEGDEVNLVVWIARRKS